MTDAPIPTILGPTIPMQEVPSLDELTRFVISRLYRTFEMDDGGSLSAVIETEFPTEGDFWVWADDNAKVLELLSIPSIWRSHPAEVSQILRFMDRLCDGPFIFRRIAAARLETLKEAEGNAEFVHALMDISCDLRRGMVSLGMRFHDNRQARYVTFTGNYVELTWHGERLVLDAETLIDETSVTRDGNIVELRHSAPLIHARRLRRSIDFGRVTYIYRIDACSMLVSVAAEVTLSPEMEVEDVLVTFGQDGLSHGENNVHYSHIVARTPAGDVAAYDAATPETRRIQTDGCGYYAIFQEEMAGFAIAVHTIIEDPHEVTGLVAVVRDPNRLHWVVSRHHFAGRHRGGVLRACEHKSITAGGLYERAADYERLWRAQLATAGSSRMALDLSISYDYGVEMNAFAKCHAALSAVPDLADTELTAAHMRAAFDRYLDYYLEHFLGLAGAKNTSVFSRQLAFAILAVATMLRATGDAVYREHLARLAEAMLAFEHRFAGITGAVESGFFMGVATNRTVYTDCHSAALLALVRAHEHLDDPKLLEAIDRGIAAFTVETVPITFAGALYKSDVVAVSWREDGAEWRSNHAFWNFQAGLTLRFFAALRASAHDGMQAIHSRHAARIATFEFLLRKQVAASTFRHHDGTDIRSSTLSSETNSETQPWVALALHGHPFD